MPKQLPKPTISINILGVTAKLTRYADSVCLQIQDADGEGLYLSPTEAKLFITAIQTLLGDDDAPRS